MNIKKLEKRLREFSPRNNPRCPICGMNFRDEYNCPHSIAEAKNHLKQKILKAKIRIETNKIMKGLDKPELPKVENT